MADLHESHSYSYKALACRVCGATYPRHIDLLHAKCEYVGKETFVERLRSGMTAIQEGKR